MTDKPPIMLDYPTSLFFRGFFTATAVVTVPALKSWRGGPYTLNVEAMFAKGEPLEEVEPKMAEIARQATVEQLLKSFTESEVTAAMADATIMVGYSHLVPISD